MRFVLLANVPICMRLYLRFKYTLCILKSSNRNVVGVLSGDERRVFLADMHRVVSLLLLVRITALQVKLGILFESCPGLWSFAVLSNFLLVL